MEHVCTMPTQALEELIISSGTGITGVMSIQVSAGNKPRRLEEWLVVPSLNAVPPL